MRCKFALANRLEEVGRVLDEMEVGLSRRDLGLEAELLGEVRLVTEEALANIVHHGFDEQDREQRIITVELTVTTESISVEICDDGNAVSPLDAPAPDFEASPESREPGGLGVHLIRSLTDEVHYARRDGQNILRLTKTRTKKDPTTE